jgi:hypothetical protein
VIAIILMTSGILIGAGLVALALGEREWGLALCMGLITLVLVAATYVACDCFGGRCLFEGSADSFLDTTLTANGDA